MRFRAGAGGRGLTHAQYLKALVELHSRACGPRADEGDEPTRKLLDELGLASVTVMRSISSNAIAGSGRT